MYLKIHKLKDRNVVALCDKELIGKRFEQGKLQLDIIERFYKGDELPKNEIVKILKNCSNLNVVGKRSIKLALELGVISKDHIIKIKGVPHGQSTIL